MHLFLTDPGFETHLEDELRPETTRDLAGHGLIHEGTLEKHRWLAFVRQTLPHAGETSAASINAWADAVLNGVIGVLPDDQPWRLHLWPAYGVGRAGLNRCDLIQKAVHERLKKRRRRLLRSLSLEASESVFGPQTSLVQVLLTSPENGWMSVLAAPGPFEFRGLVSPFVNGFVPWAEDKNAPSRAFAKLVESEKRLGVAISAGETVVDLGASPGSWSYVAIQRGAHVTALDRSELRGDLMRHPRLKFLSGDAFKYLPPQTIDWLVCDVIAAPRRSIDLVLEWLQERRMRRFIVTIKFRGTDEYPLLRQLKDQAAPLCADFHLKRLTANKNEVCVFGTLG